MPEAALVERTEIGCFDISSALGLPEPTDQQRAVIEAPLQPALVIAGAGSGKTETMANRVLWLIANNLVTPDQVLGLTFTRKAAGELSARIRLRIGQLADAGLLPSALDPFQVPTVATYNSFANSIFRENAILLGQDGDGVVLGEAAAWQLARATVIGSNDPRLPDLDKGLDQVTNAVLGLSRDIAENVVDPDEISEFANRFGSLGTLPAGSSRGEYREAIRLSRTVGSLEVLVGLAEEYRLAKLARSGVEYSDQVALALSIVRKQPRVGEDFRSRYPVVLLDEYQDTSVVQTLLLAELFEGHPVMAVGDPNQSIYGWRGASASNLEQFADRFGGAGRRFPLTTSWRNGKRILDAANVIAAPLAAANSHVAVQSLSPASRASDLAVDSLFAESLADEADSVARWFKERMAGPGTLPSAALLFRTRKAQPYFLAALREHGVPYHVLGIGGLLAEPEIADIVSALSVIHDPAAGIELVRLLAGSRWRIGVRDLHALNRLASWLRERDYAQRQHPEAVSEALRATLSDGEGGSIVEALDFIATARPGHSALANFSPVGLDRMKNAGLMMARLRSRSSLDLPDLIALVEQEFQLDIEVLANDHRPMSGATMEAFSDAVHGYLAIADVATLGGFLAWLRAAEQREDLAPRPEDPEPGTVQVLTIHGAKGLEWDVVAVPRMVVDELPSRPLQGSTGWLSFGCLPWPFRGDAADLPSFDWEIARSRKELLDAQSRFKIAVGERHLAEERRLTYVATTRARHRLLLTGSFWGTQSRVRQPSPFLRELSAAGLIGPLPDGPVEAVNPMGENLETVTWPLDPLGVRRGAVQAGAAAVLAATPRISGPWAGELSLLLAERERRLDAGQRVALPGRVPASRFKDFVTDPAAVAASMRRPMPERPHHATRLGTAFHSWVEDTYGLGRGSDELDASLDEIDDGFAVDPGELDRLRETFQRSPWAARKPVEVEREIHLPLGGQIIVCKIDAVYREGDRFEVVDWKTGKAPADAADLERKQLQLALYRLAYARWRGISPDRVDAVFYFVADDAIIRPERLHDEAELLALWRRAVLSR